MPVAMSSSPLVTTSTSSPLRIAGSAAMTCLQNAFFPWRMNSATSGMMHTLYAGGGSAWWSLIAPAIPRVRRPSEARRVARRVAFHITWRTRPVLENMNSQSSGKIPDPAPFPNWKSAMILTLWSVLLSDKLVDPVDKILLRFFWYIRSCRDPVPPTGTTNLCGCCD